MNTIRLQWDGLKELIAALRDLPAHLAEDAGKIVNEAAEAAGADIRAAYPIGPGDAHGYDGGNLRKGVRVVTRNAGQFGQVRQVRSTAPHAWIFETGTQVRHSPMGYNRGMMPGANIFVPTVMRHRRAMYEDLRQLVREAGLDVRG